MRNREVWRARKRPTLSHPVEIRQVETLPGVLRNPRTVVMATVLLMWIRVEQGFDSMLLRPRHSAGVAVATPALCRGRRSIESVISPTPSFYVVIYEVTGPLGS